MTTIEFDSSVMVLTSVLDEIVVNTDRPYLDVKISSAKGGMIFSERYWAYAGNITLWDVSYIIENFMRQTGAIILDDITLQVDYNGAKETSTSLKVLYCEALSDDGSSFDFNAQFLTTSTVRRVAPDSSVFLFAYGDSADSFSVEVSYGVKGETSIYSFTQQDIKAEDYDNLKCLRYNLQEARIEAAKVNSAVPYWQYIEIKSVNIKCGQRSARFVPDPSLAYGHIFYFRNCFNCPDFFMLSAVTKTKTEVSRSLAVYGARAVFYDQKNEKNYDVETGPLVKSEAEFIDQLISSEEVYRIIPQSEDKFLAQLILITDSNCEVVDDDDLDSIKYTWRYADNRLHRQLTADSLLRIFTYQFDRSFT